MATDMATTGVGEWSVTYMSGGSWTQIISALAKLQIETVSSFFSEGVG